MINRTLNIIVFLLFAVLFSCSAQENKSNTENLVFKNKLDKIRIKYNIPSIAAAVISTSKIDKISAVGIKKLKTIDSISINSKFHIGSCGKSFTGMIALKLVEEKIISWEVTPMDIFPELKRIIHKDYKNITFLDLLTHRAGVPAYIYWHEKEEVPKFKGTEVQKRAKLVSWQLKQKAGSERGRFNYSNNGYVIAASMMEHKTGKSWEELVEKYVFNPLKISSFGYGRPALNDDTQTWGHWIRFLDQTEQEAVAPDKYTLQSIERPAGDTHLSLKDFALYAQYHLKGLHNKKGVYDHEYYKTLHTINENYSLGWKTDYINGQKCSIHYGSEATFFAVILVFHERDLAIVIVANSATPDAKKGVSQLLKQLY